MKDSILSKELVKYVTDHFRLSKQSPHGPAHWMRVRKNGLELAKSTGANRRVVELFALFHDSCRINDNHDPGHGPRAAEFAHSCFDKGLIDCSEEELILVKSACIGHTHERTHPNSSIATCWDADRLDLARVGIIPIPEKLCTVEAKRASMIEKCSLRADQWVLKQIQREPLILDD